MQITLTLNGVRVSEEIAPDMLLIDFVQFSRNDFPEIWI